MGLHVGFAADQVAPFPKIEARRRTAEELVRSQSTAGA
jgi:hypothetical protein